MSFYASLTTPLVKQVAVTGAVLSLGAVLAASGSVMDGTLVALAVSTSLAAFTVLGQTFGFAIATGSILGSFYGIEHFRQETKDQNKSKQKALVQALGFLILGTVLGYLAGNISWDLAGTHRVVIINKI